MDPFQFWYLPLAPAFFFILVALFVFVFILLPLGLMKYAYEQLGVSPAGAVLLLLGSLLGSYINIPITVATAGEVVAFYGMQYQVPSAD